MIFTLHSPSSKIWHMLDDVSFMSGGQCIYHGSTEGASEFVCGTLGKELPLHSNPANFIGESAFFFVEYRFLLQSGDL